jgi:divalent metal cation (Fe/Co/Zn/Cd) transporter
MDSERSLLRFAWLSIAAAIVTIALKGIAWWLTGSVGLLSDALESFVNLAAAMFTLYVLAIAARPPDEEHAYGYSKAEYFGSGFEGTLILVAAGLIAAAAIERLLHPQPLASVGAGLAVNAAAGAVNFAVARVLLAAGVIAGVAAVAATGWLWLDPLLALAVAANILWWGARLMRRSVLGLLDRALPEADRRAIDAALEPYRAQGIEFHALRTRAAAGRSFVSMHVLVPGAWSVQRGHDAVEEIEEKVRAAVPGATVFTHLEPREDPASYRDVRLDRHA